MNFLSLKEWDIPYHISHEKSPTNSSPANFQTQSPTFWSPMLQERDMRRGYQPPIFQQSDSLVIGRSDDYWMSCYSGRVGNPDFKQGKTRSDSSMTAHLGHRAVSIDGIVA